MNEIVQSKTKNIFESIKKLDGNNQEYWLARELMPHLGYDHWKNFKLVINKAKTSLLQTYPHTNHHFAEISKKIRIASGTGKQATREILDFKLTRHACYLIAQNGDPSKDEIALAQAYFAIQTRRQEVQDENNKVIKRIIARRKLSETEKKFSGVLIEHGVDKKGIAEIRSAGDAALFNKPTSTMKKQLQAGKGRALADYVPTITLKAKDLATEMTTFKTNEKNLQGKNPIKFEHMHNSEAIRKMLNENGIYPEQLPAEEDIKKLERRIGQSEIEMLEINDYLELDEIVIDIRNIKDKNEVLRINELIRNHPGETSLKIIYGDKLSPKQIIRSVEISNDIISGLRKYIAIENR